ncbi:polygalacturonase inhibitor [Cinnamomum micranthum f. kanehirae]|uniref:Polygalacturonase inhibitor n=1 Tax=Cinnamomum micranthum f. kanehirae TaxID=337451 RepID=A0A443NMZ0_9MAGN|nr:polygalacturonase inhibitor [Cinnamomum micranthum f. kanehirae]
MQWDHKPQHRPHHLRRRDSSEIQPYVDGRLHLKTLIFHKLSNLTGHIQPAIAKLKNLTVIRLSWTNLSGPVPDFLTTLPNLDYLDLSFNDLTGYIPPSLTKLTKLNTLHLDHNRPICSIPEAYGRFKGSIPDLYLSHNWLTDKILKSLGDMNFSVINLLQCGIQLGSGCPLPIPVL